MKTANAGKVVDKMSLILLLVGLYASTDVIKNKMEVPSNLKMDLLYDQLSHLWECIHRR